MSHLFAFFPLVINLCYLALTLIGFGLLIFIHELGHFLAARRCKMRVEEFNIGFGRPVLSKEINQVMWRLRLLPFGGYVRIAGMEDDPEQPPTPHSYYSRSLFERAQVIFAGPLFNIVTAFVLFCAVYAFGGNSAALSHFNPFIGSLDQSSELYQKGLRPGDRILSYDDRPFLNDTHHLIAGSFAKKDLKVSAEKIDYETGNVTRFDACIAPISGKYSRRSSGISSAQALQIGAILSNSPLAQSDLMIKDRLIWADGQRLFSLQQLSELINDNCALITFSRNNTVHNCRVEKISLRHLREKASSALCGDWLTWHEKNQEKSERELICLPLQLSKGNTLLALDESQSKRAVSDLLSEEQNLRVGDRILAIDGCPVRSPDEIAALLLTKHISFVVQRPNDLIEDDGQNSLALATALQKFSDPFFSKELCLLEQKVGLDAINAGSLHRVKPIEIPKGSLAEDPERRMLGILLFDASIKFNPFPIQRLVQGMGEPLRALSGLITGAVQPKALSGPIGMAQVIYQSWSVGLNRVLDFLAVISLNLAILNLLPLPILDGGHLLFILLEKVRGKGLKTKTMQMLTTCFFLLFIVAGLYIAYQDIFRLASSAIRR